VTELDGSVSGDFFTVLCVGQGFTEDQWLNVHAFSLLRPWMLASDTVANGNASVDGGTLDTYIYLLYGCVTSCILHFSLYLVPTERTSIFFNIT